MKALSVRQPWATLIADGTKTIEVRSWKTNHRGPLLICASMRRDPGASDTEPVGVALAVVDVINCRPLVPGDEEAACVPYREELFAWEVRVLYLVEPVSVRGKLSLFDVPLTLKRTSRKVRS